jgi:hypothetical protein
MGTAKAYADLNFLIPELLGYVLARKGPYGAQGGDFSSARSAYISFRNARSMAALSRCGAR